MARLIEPGIAAAIARRVAGTPAGASTELLDDLHASLARAVPRSEELVEAASGIPAPPPVRWAVVDRGSWAEANIAGMSALLDPLVRRVADRLAKVPLPVRLAQRGLVSAEVGLLLGYVSRRVLGQYDLLVPETPSGPTRRGRRSSIAPGTTLYFVGPNMVETARRHDFVPDEFALWVALHEVTHRFQFAGVPWLRPRFFGLVEEYLGSLDVDARGLASRLAGAAREVRARSLPPDQRHPMFLLATPAQRATLERLQAMMTVVEGHGNFVMDLVGARVIPSFQRMRRTFERRRQQPGPVQSAFNHLIGLEMKLRQYEVGQRFCEEVFRRGGGGAVARLWSSPDELPTLAELREPESWLRRVA
ncbi:MAG TPA: zinc-dependent metalloprotease [Actinomycetota bacterium]|nr:zinc-dependent metalloprotease [Actinomycetota bacterium]